MAVKPHGISGMFRVCDDHEFLWEAVTSHLPYLDEAVIAYQPPDEPDSTNATMDDLTGWMAYRLREAFPDKVRIVEYPYRPYFIDHPKWKETPPDDPRSFVYVSNWALDQCRYSWIARIEADVIGLSSFEYIRDAIDLLPMAKTLYGRVVLNVAGRARDLISKENPRNGGWDEAVFPNDGGTRFVKGEKWEYLKTDCDAICYGVSGLHMKRCKEKYADGWQNEHYVPLTLKKTIELVSPNWPCRGIDPGAQLEQLWPEIEEALRETL